MVSPEKWEANRRNAKRSTGPRTAAGKETSRRNSRRHGLSSSISKDPIWAYEVHNLAKIFVPKGADHNLERAIKTVLAAMVNVMRVQAARMEVWNAALVQHSMRQREAAPIESKQELGTMIEVNGEPIVDPVVLVGVDVLPELLKLERYQRRAEAYCRRIIE